MIGPQSVELVPAMLAKQSVMAYVLVTSVVWTHSIASWRSSSRILLTDSRTLSTMTQFWMQRWRTIRSLPRD